MATAEVVTPIAAGLRGKLTKENFGPSMPLTRRPTPQWARKVGTGLT